MEINKLLNIIGKEIVKAMQSQLTSNNNTGNLSKNIKYDIHDNNELSIIMPFYGKFVDEGTCGEESCGGKYGIYNGYGSPHPRKMPPPDVIQNAYNVTKEDSYAIALSIQKKGSRSYPFVYKFNDTVDSYKNEIEKEIGIEIGDIINIKLKQTFQYN